MYEVDNSHFMGVQTNKGRGYAMWKIKITNQSIQPILQIILASLLKILCKYGIIKYAVYSWYSRPLFFRVLPLMNTIDVRLDWLVSSWSEYYELLSQQNIEGFLSNFFKQLTHYSSSKRFCPKIKCPKFNSPNFFVIYVFLYLWVLFF